VLSSGTMGDGVRNSRVRREEREKSQLLGNQRNLSIQKEKKKIPPFFFFECTVALT